MDFVHRFVRAEALVQLGAGDDVLEFDLVVGAALAGLDRLGLYRDPQPAFDVRSAPGRISLPEILAMAITPFCSPPRERGAGWGQRFKERAGFSRRGPRPQLGPSVNQRER